MAKYQNKILNINLKTDISQVLNLTVNGLKKFLLIIKISSYLSVLKDIGLGYIKLVNHLQLFQEVAQRLKIAKELLKCKGQNIIHPDEPSTGLHFKDIELLLSCIKRLKENGHTIIVIEHNQDIISKSDYIIEMQLKVGRTGERLYTRLYLTNFKI